jgi:hypothetical protein
MFLLKKIKNKTSKQFKKSEVKLNDKSYNQEEVYEKNQEQATEDRANASVIY